MILATLLSPGRRVLAVSLLFALAAVAMAGADRPARPASGSRPRKNAPAAPVPPPPPGEWTTQAGSRTDPAPAAPGPETGPPPQETPDAAVQPPDAPVPPPPDPLFDDRPVESFGPVTWTHRPSPNVVSNETYTEEACTRLLDDATLPPNARAALLGGRARARMRMWRLDEARADIESAVALDPQAAPLRLVYAEILLCLGRADDADSVLQVAVQLDPGSSFNARVLGLIRFQQGSLDSAAQALAVPVARAATSGVPAGDATLPLLQAVAAGDTSRLTPARSADAPWPEQLAAFLCETIDRQALLTRATHPRGMAPDEAACTAWFYLGQRSLTRGDRERAALDLLAAARTGATGLPEYRLAITALIRLGILTADSLPGQLAR